jgi:hypothetical protein
MTPTQIQTVPAGGSGSSAPGNSGACLPGLSRPRFFRDQLLTDQDLDALVEWAQAKFSLGRFTSGWGVVCGLAVSCDPSNPGGVTVGPGYARDGSGLDIIVPGVSALDLCQYCQPQQQPCDGSTAGDNDNENGDGNTAAQTKYTSFGDAKAGDYCVVDLFVQYCENPADARHVPRRGCCRNASGCEYARVTESYRLVGQRVPPNTMPPDPSRATARAWADQYGRWCNAARTFVKDVESHLADASQVRTRLLLWAANPADPPCRFCWLGELIKDTPDARLTDEKHVGWLLVWLLQDRRFRYLECPCLDVKGAYASRPATPCGNDVSQGIADANGDPGVPLARVWLRSSYDGAKGRTTCQVVAIAAEPPYRRAFGPRECWPAEPGKVNLGDLIWQPYEPGGVVESRLKAAQITTTRPKSPHWTCERVALLTEDVIYPRGSKLTMEVFDAAVPLGKRVVGFHLSS